MKSHTYSSILTKLYRINLLHPVKLNLTNVLEIDKLLGNPLRTVPIIHVGGTNGKGTVCKKIASCLQCSNLNVGLYSSPHISSFRERITVNNELISENDIEVRC
jgi:dihydrofolate synthase/folylpolyglutamate synthase